MEKLSFVWYNVRAYIDIFSLKLTHGKRPDIDMAGKRGVQAEEIEHAMKNIFRNRIKYGKLLENRL